MAQEDQLNMCSINNNNSNNGRPSKKQKQKKVPQRGLGVAQLEKLRLEEQHKSEELRNLSVVAAPQSDHQPLYPPPPLPPPLARVHQPPSCLVGLFKPNSWRPRHQQQQLSVVNGFHNNLQMEPPSNQSSSSNKYISISSALPPPPRWPEEEKITGTKRPWPFQIDGHPNLQSKFLTIPRLDEALTYPSWNPSFRQTGSSSTTSMKNKNFKENGASSAIDENSLTLTLGPPNPSPAVTYHQIPEFKMPTYQANVDAPLPRFGDSTNQRQYYSFLPTRETATDRDTGEAKIGNIDLNLRL